MATKYNCFGFLHRSSFPAGCSSLLLDRHADKEQLAYSGVAPCYGGWKVKSVLTVTYDNWPRIRQGLKTALNGGLPSWFEYTGKMGPKHIDIYLIYWLEA